MRLGGLRYIDCSLFESPAQTLVNAVNTVGVMGKGVARTFRDIYPDMYEEYRGFCRNGRLAPGRLWLHKSDSGKWVLNFPTKAHWRNPSKVEYLESGLAKFACEYERRGIVSVSFPMLGCGAGGLDWKLESKPLMERALSDLPIDVFVHIPSSAALYRGVSDKRRRELRDGGRPLPCFDEMWGDLVDVVNRRKGFESAHGEAWIEASGSDDVIAVGAYGGLVGMDIKRDGVIVDLWSEFSARGFFTGGNMLLLGGFAAWDIVVSLLSALPYVGTARIARREEDLGDFRAVSLIAFED